MVLRHKMIVRVAGASWFALSVWWLVEEQTPQAAVSAVMTLMAFVATLRAMVVARDGAVCQRGLFGWHKSPPLLDELTAVSLRHEAQSGYFPLTLRLSGPDAAEMSIECLAWTGWRELAHRAGHFARQLDARRDEVTDCRMGCARPGCPWEFHARDAVGGRRAGPPPDDDPSNLNLRQGLGVVVAMFVFGFALGLAGGWLKTDLDVGPLVPFALVMGGVHAVGGVFVLLWERAKGDSRPPVPPQAPRRRG